MHLIVLCFNNLNNNITSYQGVPVSPKNKLQPLFTRQIFKSQLNDDSSCLSCRQKYFSIKIPFFEEHLKLASSDEEERKCYCLDCYFILYIKIFSLKSLKLAILQKSEICLRTNSLGGITPQRTSSLQII